MVIADIEAERTLGRALKLLARCEGKHAFADRRPHGPMTARLNDTPFRGPLVMTGEGSLGMLCAARERVGHAGQPTQHARNLHSNGLAALGKHGTIEQGIDHLRRSGVEILLRCACHHQNRPCGTEAGLNFAEGYTLGALDNPEYLLDLFGSIKKHGYRVTLCFD